MDEQTAAFYDRQAPGLCDRYGLTAPTFRNAFGGQLVRREKFWMWDVARGGIWLFFSMEPTFQIGDFRVFEYHRTARQNRQIVIANLPEFGPDSPGTEAIKRITQDADHRILESDNPAHSSFRLSKSEVSHPILGTFMEKVPHAPSRPF